MTPGGKQSREEQDQPTDRDTNKELRKEPGTERRHLLHSTGKHSLFALSAGGTVTHALVSTATTELVTAPQISDLNTYIYILKAKIKTLNSKIKLSFVHLAWSI